MRCSLTPWFLMTLLALPLAARPDHDERRESRGWHHRDRCDDRDDDRREARRDRWAREEARREAERWRWERERLERERWERRREAERWERERWGEHPSHGLPMAFIPGDPWHAYVLVNGGWMLRRLDRPCHEYRTRRFEGRISIPLPRPGLSLSLVLN